MWLLCMLAACGAGSEGNPGRGGSASTGIFDESVLHEIRLTMDPEDFQSLLDDSRGDAWRSTTFQWRKTTLHDVAIRPSGESSRFPGNPKMSFKLKFNELKSGQHFEGLKRLKLAGDWGDPSFMRKRLSFWIQRRRLAAPRASHAKLFVNDQYRGVYEIDEVVDDDFAARRFGAPTGALYRARSNELSTDPYRWVGSDPAFYVPYPWDFQDGPDGEHHAELVHFLEVVTHDPAALAKVCDVDALLEFFACEAVITNTDGFLDDFSVEDHYAYFRPQTGLFHLVPWDSDNTWGSNNDSPSRSIFRFFDHSLLSALIRDTPDLRARYRQKILEILSQIPLQAVQDRVDFLYDQLRDAVDQDPFKVFTNDQFEFSRGFIKNFAAARYASLTSQAGAP